MDIIEYFCVTFEKNAIAFCRLVEGLSKIFDDVNFRFSEEGITISEIDEGRIGLGKIYISQFDFNEYLIDVPFNWSLNLDDLNKILKRFSSKNDTSIRIAGKTTSKVEIQFSNDDLSDKARKFTLSQIDLGDRSVLNISAMESLEDKFTACIDVKLKYFSRLLKDSEFYSETITFTTKKAKKEVSSLADGAQGEFEQIIPLDNYEFDDVENDFKLVWSIGYLKIFERIGKAFGTSGSKSFQEKILMLSMGDETPIQAEFELFDNSSIKFWIAPRVEEDDDWDTDEEEDDEIKEAEENEKEADEKLGIEGKNLIEASEDVKELHKEMTEQSRKDNNSDEITEEYKKLENRMHNSNCECKSCNDKYYAIEENLPHNSNCECEKCNLEFIDRQVEISNEIKIAEDKAYYAKLKEINQNLADIQVPKNKSKPALVY